MFIDPQLLEISTSLNSAMHKFYKLNQPHLWPVFHGEEIEAITQLVKEYYGIEMAQMYEIVNGIKAEELMDYHKAYELIKEVEVQLKHIEPLGGFELTPILSNGLNYIKITSIHGDFEIDFDLSESIEQLTNEISKKVLSLLSVSTTKYSELFPIESTFSKQGEGPK